MYDNLDNWVDAAEREYDQAKIQLSYALHYYDPKGGGLYSGSARSDWSWNTTLGRDREVTINGNQYHIDDLADNYKLVNQVLLDYHKKTGKEYYLIGDHTLRGKIDENVLNGTLEDNANVVSTLLRGRAEAVGVLTQNMDMRFLLDVGVPYNISDDAAIGPAQAAGVGLIIVSTIALLVPVDAEVGSIAGYALAATLFAGAAATGIWGYDIMKYNAGGGHITGGEAAFQVATMGVFKAFQLGRAIYVARAAQATATAGVATTAASAGFGTTLLNFGSKALTPSGWLGLTKGTLAAGTVNLVGRTVMIGAPLGAGYHAMSDTGNSLGKDMLIGMGVVGGALILRNAGAALSNTSNSLVTHALARTTVSPAILQGGRLAGVGNVLSKTIVLGHQAINPAIRITHNMLRGGAAAWSASPTYVKNLLMSEAIVWGAPNAMHYAATGEMLSGQTQLTLAAIGLAYPLARMIAPPVAGKLLEESLETGLKTIGKGQLALNVLRGGASSGLIWGATYATSSAVLEAYKGKDIGPKKLFDQFKTGGLYGAAFGVILSGVGAAAHLSKGFNSVLNQTMSTGKAFTLNMGKPLGSATLTLKPTSLHAMYLGAQYKLTSAAANGEEFTLGRGITNVAAGVLIGYLGYKLAAGKKILGSGLRNFAYHPGALASASATGALRWTYVSPAFTIGGALYKGLLNKAEMLIAEVFDSPESSRLYNRVIDNKRIKSHKDIPFLLGQSSTNGKLMDLLSKKGANELALSAIEGPKHGLWMGPVFGVAQVMATSTTKGKAILGALQRGPTQKGLLSHFYRDIIWMPGVVTGISESVAYFGNDGKISLASLSNWIDGKGFTPEGRTVLNDVEKEFIGYAGMLIIPSMQNIDKEVNKGRSLTEQAKLKANEIAAAEVSGEITATAQNALNASNNALKAKLKAQRLLRQFIAEGRSPDIISRAQALVDSTSARFEAARVTRDAALSRAKGVEAVSQEDILALKTEAYELTEQAQKQWEKVRDLSPQNAEAYSGLAVAGTLERNLLNSYGDALGKKIGDARQSEAAIAQNFATASKLPVIWNKVAKLQIENNREQFQVAPLVKQANVHRMKAYEAFARGDVQAAVVELRKSNKVWTEIYKLEGRSPRTQIQIADNLIAMRKALQMQRAGLSESYNQDPTDTKFRVLNGLTKRINGLQKAITLHLDRASKGTTEAMRWSSRPEGRFDGKSPVEFDALVREMGRSFARDLANESASIHLAQAERLVASQSPADAKAARAEFKKVLADLVKSESLSPTDNNVEFLTATIDALIRSEGHAKALSDTSLQKLIAKVRYIAESMKYGTEGMRAWHAGEREAALTSLSQAIGRGVRGKEVFRLYADAFKTETGQKLLVKPQAQTNAQQTSRVQAGEGQPQTSQGPPKALRKGLTDLARRLTGSKDSSSDMDAGMLSSSSKKMVDLLKNLASRKNAQTLESGDKKIFVPTTDKLVKDSIRDFFVKNGDMDAPLLRMEGRVRYMRGGASPDGTTQSMNPAERSVRNRIRIVRVAENLVAKAKSVGVTDKALEGLTKAIAAFNQNISGKNADAAYQALRAQYKEMNAQVKGRKVTVSDKVLDGLKREAAANTDQFAVKEMHRVLKSSGATDAQAIAIIAYERLNWKYDGKKGSDSKGNPSIIHAITENLLLGARDLKGLSEVDRLTDMLMIIKPVAGGKTEITKSLLSTLLKLRLSGVELKNSEGKVVKSDTPFVFVTANKDLVTQILKDIKPADKKYFVEIKAKNIGDYTQLRTDKITVIDVEQYKSMMLQSKTQGQNLLGKALVVSDEFHAIVLAEPTIISKGSIKQLGKDLFEDLKNNPSVLKKATDRIQMIRIAADTILQTFLQLEAKIGTHAAIDAMVRNQRDVNGREIMEQFTLRGKAAVLDKDGNVIRTIKGQEYVIRDQVKASIEAALKAKGIKVTNGELQKAINDLALALKSYQMERVEIKYHGEKEGHLVTPRNLNNLGEVKARQTISDGGLNQAYLAMYEAMGKKGRINGFRQISEFSYFGYEAHSRNDKLTDKATAKETLANTGRVVGMTGSGAPLTPLIALGVLSEKGKVIQFVREIDLGDIGPKASITGLEKSTQKTLVDQVREIIKSQTGAKGNRLIMINEINGASRKAIFEAVRTVLQQEGKLGKWRLVETGPNGDKANIAGVGPKEAKTDIINEVSRLKTAPKSGETAVEKMILISAFKEGVSVMDRALPGGGRANNGYAYIYDLNIGSTVRFQQAGARAGTYEGSNRMKGEYHILFDANHSMLTQADKIALRKAAASGSQDAVRMAMEKVMQQFAAHDFQRGVVTVMEGNKEITDAQRSRLISEYASQTEREVVQNYLTTSGKKTATIALPNGKGEQVYKAVHDGVVSVARLEAAGVSNAGAAMNALIANEIVAPTQQQGESSPSLTEGTLNRRLDNDLRAEIGNLLGEDAGAVIDVIQNPTGIAVQTIVAYSDLGQISTQELGAIKALETFDAEQLAGSFSRAGISGAQEAADTIVQMRDSGALPLAQTKNFAAIIPGVSEFTELNADDVIQSLASDIVAQGIDLEDIAAVRGSSTLSQTQMETAFIGIGLTDAAGVAQAIAQAAQASPDVLSEALSMDKIISSAQLDIDQDTRLKVQQALATAAQAQTLDLNHGVSLSAGEKLDVASEVVYVTEGGKDRATHILSYDIRQVDKIEDVQFSKLPIQEGGYVTIPSASTEISVAPTAESVANTETNVTVKGAETYKIADNFKNTDQVKTFAYYTVAEDVPELGLSRGDRMSTNGKMRVAVISPKNNATRATAAMHKGRMYRPERKKSSDKTVQMSSKPAETDTPLGFRVKADKRGLDTLTSLGLTEHIAQINADESITEDSTVFIPYIEFKGALTKKRQEQEAIIALDKDNEIIRGGRDLNKPGRRDVLRKRMYANMQTMLDLARADLDVEMVTVPDPLQANSNQMVEVMKVTVREDQPTADPTLTGAIQELNQTLETSFYFDPFAEKGHYAGDLNATAAKAGEGTLTLGYNAFVSAVSDHVTQDGAGIFFHEIRHSEDRMAAKVATQEDALIGGPTRVYAYQPILDKDTRGAYGREGTSFAVGEFDAHSIDVGYRIALAREAQEVGDTEVAHSLGEAASQSAKRAANLMNMVEYTHSRAVAQIDSGTASVEIKPSGESDIVSVTVLDDKGEAYYRIDQVIPQGDYENDQAKTQMARSLILASATQKQTQRAQLDALGHVAKNLIDDATALSAVTAGDNDQLSSLLSKAIKSDRAYRGLESTEVTAQRIVAEIFRNTEAGQDLGDRMVYANPQTGRSIVVDKSSGKILEFSSTPAKVVDLVLMKSNSSPDIQDSKTEIMGKFRDKAVADQKAAAAIVSPQKIERAVITSLDMDKDVVNISDPKLKAQEGVAIEGRQIVQQAAAMLNKMELSGADVSRQSSLLKQLIESDNIYITTVPEKMVISESHISAAAKDSEDADLAGLKATYAGVPVAAHVSDDNKLFIAAGHQSSTMQLNIGDNPETVSTIAYKVVEALTEKAYLTPSSTTGTTDAAMLTGEPMEAMAIDTAPVVPTASMDAAMPAAIQQLIPSIMTPMISPMSSNTETQPLINSLPNVAQQIVFQPQADTTYLSQGSSSLTSMLTSTLMPTQYDSLSKEQLMAMATPSSVNVGGDCPSGGCDDSCVGTACLTPTASLLGSKGQQVAKIDLKKPATQKKGPKTSSRMSKDRTASQRDSRVETGEDAVARDTVVTESGTKVSSRMQRKGPSSQNKKQVSGLSKDTEMPNARDVVSGRMPAKTSPSQQLPQTTALANNNIEFNAPTFTGRAAYFADSTGTSAGDDTYAPADLASISTTQPVMFTDSTMLASTKDAGILGFRQQNGRVNTIANTGTSAVSLGAVTLSPGQQINLDQSFTIASANGQTRQIVPLKEAGSQIVIGDIAEPIKMTVDDQKISLNAGDIVKITSDNSFRVVFDQQTLEPKAFFALEQQAQLPAAPVQTVYNRQIDDSLILAGMSTANVGGREVNTFDLMIKPDLLAKANDQIAKRSATMPLIETTEQADQEGFVTVKASDKQMLVGLTASPQALSKNIGRVVTRLSSTSKGAKKMSSAQDQKDPVVQQQVEAAQLAKADLQSMAQAAQNIGEQGLVQQINREIAVIDAMLTPATSTTSTKPEAIILTDIGEQDITQAIDQEFAGDDLSRIQTKLALSSTGDRVFSGHASENAIILMPKVDQIQEYLNDAGQPLSAATSQEIAKQRILHEVMAFTQPTQTDADLRAQMAARNDLIGKTAEYSGIMQPHQAKLEMDQIARADTQVSVPQMLTLQDTQILKAGLSPQEYTGMSSSMTSSSSSSQADYAMLSSINFIKSDFNQAITAYNDAIEVENISYNPEPIILAILKAERKLKEATKKKDSKDTKEIKSKIRKLSSQMLLQGSKTVPPVITRLSQAMSSGEYTPKTQEEKALVKEIVMLAGSQLKDLEATHGKAKVARIRQEFTASVKAIAASANFKPAPTQDLGLSQNRPAPANLPVISFTNQFEKSVNTSSANFTNRWDSVLSNVDQPSVQKAAAALSKVETKLAEYDTAVTVRRGKNPRDGDVGNAERIDCWIRNQHVVEWLGEELGSDNVFFANTGKGAGQPGYHAYGLFKVGDQWFSIDAAADQFEPDVETSKDIGLVIMPAGRGDLTVDPAGYISFSQGMDTDWAYSNDLMMAGAGSMIYGSQPREQDVDEKWRADREQELAAFKERNIDSASIQNGNIVSVEQVASSIAVVSNSFTYDSGIAFVKEGVDLGKLQSELSALQNDMDAVGDKSSPVFDMAKESVADYMDAVANARVLSTEKVGSLGDSDYAMLTDSGKLPLMSLQVSRPRDTSSNYGSVVRGGAVTVPDDYGSAVRGSAMTVPDAPTLFMADDYGSAIASQTTTVEHAGPMVQAIYRATDATDQLKTADAIPSSELPVVVLPKPKDMASVDQANIRGRDVYIATAAGSEFKAYKYDSKTQQTSEVAITAKEIPSGTLVLVDQYSASADNSGIQNLALRGFVHNQVYNVPTRQPSIVIANDYGSAVRGGAMTVN